MIEADGKRNHGYILICKVAHKNFVATSFHVQTPRNGDVSMCLVKQCGTKANRSIAIAPLRPECVLGGGYHVTFPVFLRNADVVWTPILR